MGDLAGWSGKDAIRVFERFGYRVIRQRGSHVRLQHTDLQRRPLTIPLHRELKVGLLRQLIQDAGMSIQDFLNG